MRLRAVAIALVVVAVAVVALYRLGSDREEELPLIPPPSGSLPADTPPKWRALWAVQQQVHQEAQRDFPGQALGISCWIGGIRRVIRCEVSVGGQRQTPSGVDFKTERAKTIHYTARFDRTRGKVTEIRRTDG